MDIQLQDIIQIHWNKVEEDSPRYIVDFISSERFRIINIDNLEITTILLNGGIPDTGEETIVQIDILNRSDQKGYAEQNNLEPGVWINIGFNNELPIKGRIIEKEEDMIVVKLALEAESLFDAKRWNIEERKDSVDPAPDWADDSPEEDDVTGPKFISRWDDSPEEATDKVYVDFKYEGIPDNVTIQIIDNPLLINVEPTKIEHPVDEIPIEFDINFNPSDETIELYQEVEVPEDEKRYDLPTQLDDLLDDLLSDIPTDLRTREKLNQLNIILDRFKELRYQFSNIDENGYIKSLKIHGPDYNPVSSALENLNQSLFWLIPVVKNKRKIYDVEGEDLEDVVETRLKTYIELENRYQEAYESHNTQNRYMTLLLNQQILNKEYLLPDQSDDLMKRIVNTNLPVVINNAIGGEDRNSSVFGSKASGSSGASIMTIPNATAVYSLPTTYLKNNDINIKLPRNRQFISDKDSVILKDFIKLNKLAIAYSTLYLPATNIYLKSILNATPRYLYRFLKRKITNQYIENDTPENELPEDTDDKAKESSTINKNIQYKPISNDNLGAFIKTIVPTITDKIDYITDMNPPPLSIYSSILALESFLVYANTVDQETVIKLQEVINTKIDDLKLAQKNHLDHLDRAYHYPVSKGEMMLDKSVFKEIIDKVEDIPDFKFLKNMLAVDGCTLYTLLLAQKNFALHITKEVETYAEDAADAEDTDGSPEDPSSEESLNCKKYEIAKQYTTKEELEADNSKDIYYDSHLDPTRYDTMEVYKPQLESVSSDKEKETFLIHILQQTVGMTVEQAKEEATALFQLKRTVPEGVFALLTVDNVYTYFKRIDKEWVEDTSIPKIPLESNTIFCNIQPKCLSLKSECETINNIKIPSYMDKMKTFDSAIEKELTLFKEQVTADISYYIGYYNKSVYIESLKKLKNNNMYYSLGLESGANPPTPSPYLELMTAIIGQSDFVKRQHDIMQFVALYTRSAEEEENQYFHYCVKTSVPLMPTFLVALASTWITSPSEYITTLNSICFKQGKLSDDGDSWVDGHSGYVIKMIETVSEFHSTGPDLILSNDLFIAPKKKIELSSILDTIVYAITHKLGINIEKQLEDMKNIYNDLIENRAFLKSSAQFQKAKKSTDPAKAYKKYKNMLLVRAAIATYISVIQTSIPNYKSRTTNPGCVKDFSGYPLSNNTENTGCIKYILCIAQSLSSPYEPWKYILPYKKNVEKFESHLVKDISKIAETEKYQLLKRKKIEYLELNPNIVTPTILTTNWAHFSPPLDRIEQHSVEPCNTKVLDDLQSDLIMGNKDQYDKINILNGKIQLFSISVLKTISTAISKKAALLSNSFNEPFLENSCCQEQHNTGILTYLFGPPLTNIINDLNHINSYDAMIDDIHQLGKASTILCLENTMLGLTDIIPDYSESIIILAIIKFCNYDNFKLVPDNLISICGDKPENYNSFDSFANKTEIIKADSGQLTKELLFSMLKVVYKKTENPPSESILYGHSNVLVNYVTRFANIHQSPPVDEIVALYVESNEDILEEYITAEKEKKVPTQMKITDAAIRYYNEQLEGIDSQALNLNRLLFNTLETINMDIYSDTVLDLMDQIDTFNKLSLERIKDVISDQDMPIRLKQLFIKKKTSKESPFIDELLHWKDNNVSNNISWLQYMVYYLTTILPNIIINDYKYENIKIPKYWNLHHQHELKIKNMISSEVAGSEFNPFIRVMYNDDLDTWFNTIKPSLDYYLALSKSVIVRDSGMFDETTSKKLLEYCVLEVCKLYIGDEEGSEEVQGYRDRVLFIAMAMNMFSVTKKNINWSVDEIVYDVNKSKETEKEAVINRLESMSDEEKQLDKEMKNLKLGPWSIDHVTSYNAAEWAKTDIDAETAALAQEADEHDNISDYLGENGDE